MTMTLMSRSSPYPKDIGHTTGHETWNYGPLSDQGLITLGWSQLKAHEPATSEILMRRGTRPVQAPVHTCLSTTQAPLLTLSGGEMQYTGFPQSS